MSWPKDKTDNSKSRACPFCDGTEITVATGNSLPNWLHLECDACGAYSMGVPQDYPNIREVLIKKWNRRAYKVPIVVDPTDSKR